MARTLAFLHTAPLLIPVFSTLAKEKLPGVACFHMLDESLLKNTMAAGKLEKTTVRRVAAHVESAGEAGADAVLVTCSSIGPAVDIASALVDFPVLRIDAAMAEEAVARGERIGVAATLRTTLEPTAELLRRTAADAAAERTILPRLCEGAYEAVVAGDPERHDRLVREGLAALAAECDVIVLAQASMARVADGLSASDIHTPILSSPALGVERARQTLETL